MAEGLTPGPQDLNFESSERIPTAEADLLDTKWKRRIEGVVSKIDLYKIMGPTNSKEQQALFLSGEQRNPKFEYGNVPQDETVNDWRKQIIDLEQDVVSEEENPLVKTLYRARCQELGVQFDFIEAIGKDDAKFYQSSDYLFGTPTEFDMNTALAEREERKSLVRSTEDREESEEEDQKKLNATQIKRVFDHALEEYGFRWGVEVTDKVAAITVKATGVEHPGVFIPESREVSMAKLQGLLAHEIETHVLRGENAKYTNLGILQDTVKLDHYLATEEGLASHQEREAVKRVTGRDTVPGLNSVAVALAGTHDFRETYEELRKLGASEKSAWSTTARVFRGIKDTGNHNGYRNTIDWSYRRGALGIREFIYADGNLQRLYIGKCGLQHLQMLWQLGIKDPKIQSKNLKIEDLLSEK